MFSNIFCWLEEKDEDLAVGLVAGLAWGLVGGLVAGLAGGLVAGLAWGLAWGLVVGLIQGEYGLMIVPVLVVWFLAAELVYVFQARVFEKRKYETLWRVCSKELEALFDTGLVGFNALNLWWLANKITISWELVTQTGQVIGNVVVVIILFGMIVGVVYGYLKLNQYVANINIGKGGRKGVSKR